MNLKKGITFFGVFSIATGAMISSGIFILPGFAFARTGPSVFISYFVAGILGLLGILSVIELATAMPRAGGDYYFINKAFGPALGTMSGFLGWFALSLKSAFAIFGIAEIIHIFTGVNVLISGLITCIFFVSLNIVGVKEAARFQTMMVTGLLTLMVIYAVSGISELNMNRFTPFVKDGVNEIFVTSGFIFISFGGLLKVANVSEEVVNPKRNIPLGLISSVIIVTILYTAVTFMITGTLDGEAFANSLTPVADSARNFMGETGYYLILAASFLAFFTTANAGIMSASRYPMALSRDELMPAYLGRVNERFKTPVLAILLTGVLIYLSLLLPLDVLVKAASTVILTSYVLTNIAVIILRESGLTNYRPSFKAPLYPFLQIFCILLFSFFIVDMGMDAIEISLALLFLSFCLYMVYGRKKKQRESALLHLLKRITDRQLVNNVLDDELREVVINRDEIEQDNFDELIKDCLFIDMDGPCNFENVLEQTAKAIAKETGMADGEIKKRFLKRQEESNTAVSDFLALPHIVIEGEGKMFLHIVRCREGVKFTEKENTVKAIFLLGGTAEKRLLHLKTLASMATLVGMEHFQDRWLTAKDGTEIKNLMLLNERKRYN
ncbi:MAG: amino acid permease [Spirochaetales bacterium]|nr:amino acid permease [Spirochaetales bacterium]